MSKGSKDREMRYVYDLRYSDRNKLCNMLDVNDKWKYVGGAIGYSIDDINNFDLAFKRNGSPTDSMLTDWGHKNPTIIKFYEILQRQELIREMEVLEKYLPPEMRGGSEHCENDMSSFDSANFNRADLPRPNDEFPRKVVHPESHVYNRNRSIDEHTQDSNYSFNSLPKPSMAYPQYPPNQSGFYRSSSQNQEFCHASYPQKIPCQGQDPTSLRFDEFSKPNYSHFEPSQKRREPVESQDYSEMKKEEIPESPSSGLQRFAAENMIRFDMKEIRTGTSGFKKGLELGSGGFGTVYKCKLNGTYYAVKRLEKDKGCNHSLAEIKALSRYRHENIVQLCGYSHDEEKDQFILVLEFLRNGSLEDRLNCKDNTVALTWKQRHSIMLDAARGVLYLHNTASDKLLFHGDIKSANILLDANFKAKISDFGLAKETKKSNVSLTTTKGSTLKTTCYGSEHYLPPEYKRNGKPSAKVDVHCFGVVLLEVTTGRPPLIDGNTLLKETIADKYEQGKVTPNEFKDKQARDWPDHYWNDMLKLGLDCTEIKAKQRPEMNKVFEILEELQEKIQQGEIQKTSMTGKPSESDLVSNAVNFKSGEGANPSLHGEQPKKGRHESQKLDKQVPYVKTGPCTQESVEEEAQDPKWLAYDRRKLMYKDSNSTDIYSADPVNMSYDYKKLGENPPYEDPNNREAMKLQRHYDEENSMKSKDSFDKDSANVVSLHKEGGKKKPDNYTPKTVGAGAYCMGDTTPKTLAENSKMENLQSLPDESLAKDVKNLRLESNGSFMEEVEIKKKAETKKFLPFLDDASSLNSYPDQSLTSDFGKEDGYERNSDEEQASCGLDDSAAIAETAAKKSYPAFLDTESICSSISDHTHWIPESVERSTQSNAEEMPMHCFNRVSTMGNNSQVNVTAPSRVYSDK